MDPEGLAVKVGQNADVESLDAPASQTICHEQTSPYPVVSKIYPWRSGLGGISLPNSLSFARCES